MNMNNLSLAELETRVAQEVEFNEEIKKTLTGTVTRETPIIKTLEDARKFAEQIKRESLMKRIEALSKSTNQMVRSAMGLDGRGPQKGTVEAVCADCGNLCQVSETLDMSRPVYCQTCLPKHRKNRPGT